MSLPSAPALRVPDRPLRLRGSFVAKNLLGGLALILLGIGAIVLYGFLEKDSVTQLLADKKVWETGVPASFTEVTGEERSKNYVFREYRLVARYGDKEMQAHSGDVKFDTFLTSVDQEAPREVRYLEADPKQFTLSWAIDAIPGRWLSIGFLGLVGFLIGAMMVWGGRKMLGHLSLARHCGRRSEALSLEITRITPQVANGKQVGLEYGYRGSDPDGRTLEGKVTFKKKEDPLFADAERKFLVGLHSPAVRDKVLVLRSDLHPYVAPVRG